MANINVSELQFAFTFFAKFNSLFENSFSNVIVPSTYSEGRDDYEYRGADLVLDNYFIQFKKSDIMLRKKNNILTKSYFRFYTKNDRGNGSYGQLDFLKQHCNNSENIVLYISPSFDAENFVTTERSRNYWFRSFYQSVGRDFLNFCSLIDVRTIDNSWIDERNHEICYKHSDDVAYFFSEPKEIKKTSLNRDFTPSKGRTLQTIMEEFADEEFFVKQISTRSIREVQKKILYKYNVFWIPIIKNENHSQS